MTNFIKLTDFNEGNNIAINIDSIMLIKQLFIDELMDGCEITFKYNEDFFSVKQNLKEILYLIEQS